MICTYKYDMNLHVRTCKYFTDDCTIPVGYDGGYRKPVPGRALLPAVYPVTPTPPLEKPPNQHGRPLRE